MRRAKALAAVVKEKEELAREIESRAGAFASIIEAAGGTTEGADPGADAMAKKPKKKASSDDPAVEYAGVHGPCTASAPPSPTSLRTTRRLKTSRIPSHWSSTY